MPKVEIESFWDRLGVELWPNYCFETQNFNFCGGAGGGDTIKHRGGGTSSPPRKQNTKSMLCGGYPPIVF